jgi:hypothetical protein
MIGAATFKVSAYEEIEADKSATSQAIIVVILVAIATGIGLSTSKELWGTFIGVVVALIGWALWAWITYFIGTTLFKAAETEANWGQLARTVGFAQAPGLLNVAGLVSFGSEVVLSVIFLITFFWTAAAMVIAIRQALDYKSTGRAIWVVLIAAVPYFILRIVMAILLPGASPSTEG